MPLFYKVSRAEDSFKVLLYQNPNPRWITDCKTFKFLEVNDAATLEYGYTRDEFLKMTLDELYMKEYITQFYKVRKETFNELTSYYKEVRHVTKHGGVLNKEIVSYKVNFEGTISRLAVITDITERKRIEKELNIYITKLENLAFYNSHNLRKPVANLMGLMQLLTDSEDCPIVQMIKESVAELDVMIKDVGKKIHDSTTG